MKQSLKTSDPRVAPSTREQIEAADVLAEAYEDRACEEALFRALTAEKTGDTGKGIFWVGVYIELKTRDYKA